MTLLALPPTGDRLLDKQNFALHDCPHLSAESAQFFCEDDPVGTKLILQCDASESSKN